MAINFSVVKKKKEFKWNICHEFRRLQIYFKSERNLILIALECRVEM